MKTRTQNSPAGRSLTATLAVAFLALSVVVLLISGGLQIFSNIQTQQGVISDRQQLIAQEAARTVGSFIQEKLGVLETTVRLADPATASSEAQKQILQSLLGLQPPFRQLVLLNAQDQELAKSSRLSQSVSGRLADQLKSDVLAQIRQGARYISSVYIDPVTSEPLVIMAVPAANALGDFQGTLAAEVNLKVDLWDLVDRLKVGETGLAYVVDRQGNLIAFGDTARVLKGENVGQLKTVSDFIHNPAPARATGVSTYQGIQGNMVVGAYVPLGTPDWAVVTEVPWAEAYQEVIRNAAVSAGVTLVMAVLAGLVGAFLARRLAVPLVNLTGIASRIAGGEMELQAVVGGPNEVASLAMTFNSMTHQLQSLISSLEQRVAERTAELTQRSQELEKLNLELEATTRQTGRRAARLVASAQVMRAVSQVRELGRLLPEVTQLISRAFGFYHVGVFIVDEAAKYAVLQAANSEGGQRMLARTHKLAVGTQGIVGRVTGSGEPHIALDVTSDAVHRVNPDLPDTRSEMALPLRVGGQTFGALDVQSTEENAFAQEDISTLETMADQIAIAIENVRLLEQTQAALREAEEVQSRFMRQEWEQLLPTLASATHEYRLSSVPRLGDATLPEIEQALERNDVVTIQGGASAPGVRSALAVPIRLRDQIIGVIDLHETELDRAWTQDEVALVMAVADQAAQALENARLFEQTQQRARREQLVTQIATRVRAAQDVESILRAGVQEIRRVLGASHGIARLNTESQLPIKGKQEAD